MATQLIHVRVLDKRDQPINLASVQVYDPDTGEVFLRGQTDRAGDIRGLRMYDTGATTALRVSARASGHRRSISVLVTKDLVTGLTGGYQAVILYPIARKRHTTS